MEQNAGETPAIRGVGRIRVVGMTEIKKPPNEIRGLNIEIAAVALLLRNDMWGDFGLGYVGFKCRRGGTNKD